MDKNEQHGLRWVKSSLSFANGNCVEVAADVTGVLMRDSQDKGGPWLAFDTVAWGAFLAMVRST
jgi:hypothetical protein